MFPASTYFAPSYFAPSYFGGGAVGTPAGPAVGNVVTQGFGTGGRLVTQGYEVGPAPIVLTLPEALVSAIRADATLAGLIDGRVYPGHLAEGATYPAVSMEIPGHAFGQSLDGGDGTADARVTFRSHSLYALESKRIVRALFDRFNPIIRETIGGLVILAAVADDDADDYSDPDDGSDDGTHTDAVSFLFLYAY